MAASPAPISLAVTPFTNHSGETRFDPLGKGLSDMLITDLSSVTSLQLLERERIQAVLDEMKLSQTEFVDPSTAQKMGRGLGASHLLTGAFLAISPKIRIDARMVEVETGKVIKAWAVEGESADFFVLEKDLAGRIVEGLEIKVTAREGILMGKVATESFDAMVAWSHALDAFDAGRLDAARAALEEVLRVDSSFLRARSALDAVTARLDTLRQRHQEARGSSLRSLEERINSLVKLKGPWTELPPLLSPRWGELSQPANARASARICRTLLGGDLPETILLVPEQPGSGSLASFLLYQAVMAASTLKDDSTVLAYGEKYLERHPGSVYYPVVEGMVQRSLKRQRDIAEGREKAPREVAEKKYQHLTNLLPMVGMGAPPAQERALWRRIEAAAAERGKPVEGEHRLRHLRHLLRAGDDKGGAREVEILRAKGGDPSPFMEGESLMRRREEEHRRVGQKQQEWSEKPSPHTAERLGAALLEVGDAAAAAALAHSALQRFADSPPGERRPLWKLTVDSVIASGEWSKVVDALAAWEARPEEERPEKAWAFRVREQARKTPNEINSMEALWLYLEGAALQQMSQYGPASDAFAAYASSPHVGAGATADVALYMAATCAYEAGQFPRARALFEALRTQHPQSSMGTASLSLQSLLPDDDPP